MYESINARELKIDTRELAARLGAPINARIDGMDELLENLVSVAKPMYSTARVNINRQKDGLMIGKRYTESRALGEVIRGCDECILLAATLGVGVDRLILKTASLSPRDAFLLDAMADALVEALCDEAQVRACRGFDVAPRFSPGYADLELSFGKEILALTDAERLLGIKLSESGLMIPKKSVNAIIAIRNKNND